MSFTEYLYVTVRENVESIQALAGERWEEAVITLTRSTTQGHLDRTLRGHPDRLRSAVQKSAPASATQLAECVFENLCTDRFAERRRPLKRLGSWQRRPYRIEPLNASTPKVPWLMPGHGGAGSTSGAARIDIVPLRESTAGCGRPFDR
jgi:hypothetical protein